MSTTSDRTAPRLLLKVVDPKQQPLTHPIRGGQLTVGRDPRQCEIALPSDAVLPRHFSLRFVGDKVVVVAHGGPIHIDGKLVDRPIVHLDPDQTLEVAGYRFTVLRPEAERAADPEREESSAAQVYREAVRRKLVHRLDLRRRDITQEADEALRDQVSLILHDVIREPDTRLPPELDGASFVTEMTDECLGLGAIEDLLRDRDVSEIMVVDTEHIYAERRGRIHRINKRFTSDEALEIIIQRIVRPLGRRIDQSVPMVDARLKDGSRVNAVIPPLAVRGPCLTIRKFPSNPLSVDDLIAYGSMTARMARFLERSVKAKQNILISGGTGSGKTTLLNVLSSYIWPDERVVTVEDAAELQLRQEHVVSLETRPPSLEGKGAYTIRDLVRNALRMRPDRIIVGECRGSEAIDMLQAMNTGHAGSMTTVHANNPRDSLSRLETLVLLADKGLSNRAVREQIVQSIGLVVQQSRLQGGVRKVTHISEVAGLDTHGDFIVEDIFRFVADGIDAQGRIVGGFKLTGQLPSYLGEMITLGLVDDGEFI